MKHKIKALTLSVLFLLFIITGCNQQFKAEIENGKQAMINNNYDVAVEAFSNAVAEDPDNYEAHSLLDEAKQKQAIQIMEVRKAELTQEIKEYVVKTMTIHDKFVDVFTIPKKTQNDASEMNNLLIEADFTPPKSIYEIHQLYIQFLKHHVKSADLYVLGDIKQSITEMETASDYFSEYKHMFNYFLGENGIQKSDVGWAF